MKTGHKLISVSNESADIKLNKQLAQERYLRHQAERQNILLTSFNEDLTKAVEHLETERQEIINKLSTWEKIKGWVRKWF